MCPWFLDKVALDVVDLVVLASLSLASPASILLSLGSWTMYLLDALLYKVFVGSLRSCSVHAVHVCPMLAAKPSFRGLRPGKVQPSFIVR